MVKDRITRVRILYLLLLILIGVSVLPLWFYGSRMISMNQDVLARQENVLQSTIAQSLAQQTALYMENLRGRLEQFSAAVLPIIAGVDPAKFDSSAELRKSLEAFVADNPSIIYATVLNTEAKGVQAGGYVVAGNDFVFLAKRLEEGFTATSQGADYYSDPTMIVRSGVKEPVMIVSIPLKVKGSFLGMVAAVVTITPIQERMNDAGGPGFEAYIVDNIGRLVASNDPDAVTGRDMVSIPIVRDFLNSQARFTETSTFDLQLRHGDTTTVVQMRGTYSPIRNLGWGVIVQRKLSDAYYSVDQMRKQTFWWGLGFIVLILAVSFFSAKTITRPLDQLTRTARSIAQRDFTQRADIRSHTEIGELAETFNRMAEDIQQYISDLRNASEENRQLFIDSIEMIAAAVDAKDPYTKGHSRRVSQYSVALARELGLETEEIDKIRISATLHDVGKIGVEDRVLKKPGVLTNEEFEIMKRHTVMGFEIVRQVKQLAEMLPGIRWHHEALNGKGYPDGIKGDELPLMCRIIAVADTFDAVTTDRPYQAGRDFPSGLEILRKHAGTKYDPIVVDALHAAYNKGDLRKYETKRSSFISVPQPTQAAG
ncbi:MAG: HD domain-containing protein [Acidobacteria bacterium]|nr:HD domain-containing protein [Acidobacteriota bacterium]